MKRSHVAMMMGMEMIGHYESANARMKSWRPPEPEAPPEVKKRILAEAQAKRERQAAKRAKSFK